VTRTQRTLFRLSLQNQFSKKTPRRKLFYFLRKNLLPRRQSLKLQQKLQQLKQQLKLPKLQPKQLQKL